MQEGIAAKRLSLPRGRAVLLRGLGASTRAHPDGPQLVRVVFELGGPRQTYGAASA